MATKKKRTRIKKKMSARGGATLIDGLKDEVINGLKGFQSSGGRDGIRSQFANMMNPTKFDASFLVGMIGRTQTFHGLIKAAKENGELSPFVMPMMAAIAFESVFECCAAFWMAAGDPPTATQLKPAVEDFVDTQVSAFGACLGSS